MESSDDSLLSDQQQRRTEDSDSSTSSTSPRNAPPQMFKNPRYNRDISVLAQQMTPGKLDLKMIYAAATTDPFSYLFINVTQECKPAVKYLSHLFNEKHKVNAYVVN